MNVIMLLRSKDTVSYIYKNNTLRQGLEKMRAHGYTAIPVIDEDGYYAGTVSEGDFLWHIVYKDSCGMKQQENYSISDIMRKDFNPAVKIDVDMKELLDRSMKQNFIPVTDDRGTFIGIVTRQDIIRQFVNKEE